VRVVPPYLPPLELYSPSMAPPPPKGDIRSLAEKKRGSSTLRRIVMSRLIGGTTAGAGGADCIRQIGQAQSTRNLSAGATRAAATPVALNFRCLQLASEAVLGR
jgi:hypothetical protein